MFITRPSCRVISIKSELCIPSGGLRSSGWDPICCKLWSLEKDWLNSVQLFLKSHPLRVTTNKNFIIITLAWEPSAAKDTKIYSRRLPALERFYRETKVNPLNLGSQNQAKNIPVGLLSLRQIGPGVPELWSDKQTEKQRLQLYTKDSLYIYALHLKKSRPRIYFLFCLTYSFTKHI